MTRTEFLKRLKELSNINKDSARVYILADVWESITSIELIGFNIVINSTDNEDIKTIKFKKFYDTIKELKGNKILVVSSDKKIHQIVDIENEFNNEITIGID